MEKKTYHHGDLRRTLIETGIELISREGEEKLSLEHSGENESQPLEILKKLL